MKNGVLSLACARQGHFLYESGHHGDLWLDLETLCRRPTELRPLVSELASRLASYKPEVVCGPLVEGAFVGLLVANELGCEFTYANRFAGDDPTQLFGVKYRVPATLRPVVKGKRIVIVNDVTSAGSAVRGTYEDLVDAGARVIAVGCLLLLGEPFASFADEHGLAVEALETRPHHLWTAEECPLCKEGVRLEKLAVA
jgi:orotate phosphoribosyltransferase